MLVGSCPHCGRPSQVSLASPLMQCAACGYQGRVPPALEQSMQGANAVLQSLDARGRQLDSRQRRTLSSSGVRSFLVLIPAVVVTVPALLTAAFGTLFLFRPSPDIAMFLFSIVPLSVVGVAEVLAIRAMRRSHRALLEACAATPPAATGGKAACHLCGAPLEGSTEAVVRCGYCRPAGRSM